MSAQKIVEEFLAKADIRINGSRPWDLQVKDERFFNRVLSGGRLALGDAYVDQWWECEALDELMYRAAAAKLDERLPYNLNTALLALRSKLCNLQYGKRAFEVAGHYDEDPKFYGLFLDKRMTYTCGNWDGVDTLDEAQEQKLERTCRAVELRPDERVLDIGCGWGSFMGYAAERHGARCDGLTIAPHQAEYAMRRYVQGERRPVKALVCNYEDYKPNFLYDKLVSVGMFEHVGRKNYGRFFAKAYSWLMPGGLFLLHTIWTEGRLGKCPWLNARIFPNGELGRPFDITRATHGKFVIRRVDNFGPDYDRTTMAWYANLKRNRTAAVALMGERAYRTYSYYFRYVAGGFRAKVISVGRLTLELVR